MRSVLLLLALSLARPATAQSRTSTADTATTAPPAGAVRVAAGERIRLDGRLDDAPWAAVPPISDFRQHDPDVGAAATERTEVRVLFDSSTLYVAVLAHDSRPAEVIARILARDQLMSVDDFSGQLEFAGDDAIAILLDPFRDRRNAVVFATNVNGAEFDAQVTDQGREVNVAWRTVWRVAATRTDSGWSAELEIPLRSIRRPDDGRAWGLNVYRVIRRKNEHVMWRSWSRDNAGFLKVSEAGELAGISGLARAGLGVELKTSGIARAVRGDVDGRTNPADASLDLKYQLRPGVTLDATANTDFAQADVDDVQVNLTRFSLFFPEKRDFFLENAGVFEFGARGVFEPPPWLMFFSRRIGISDSGEIPVLGGVRFTGREGRQTFGAMHMRTDATPFVPRASYTTARFKRDVAGDGYIGAMYAGGGTREAGSAGVDFQYWPTSTLNLQGFAAQVWDSSAGAVGAAARAHRLLADRQVDRWGVRVERMVIGDEADPPLGFAVRTGIARSSAQLRVAFRPPVPGVRRLTMFNFADHVTRTDGALQDWGVGPAFDLVFNSGENLTAYRLQAVTVLDEPFDLADRVAVAAGRYGNSQTGLLLASARHRPVRVNLHSQHQSFYGGSLFFVNGTAELSVGARGTAALMRAFNDAKLPSGQLVTNVSALRLGYAFSTHAGVSTTAQFNSLDRVANMNARFSYQYRPGSEIFLVLNSERASPAPAAGQPRSALLKLTYLSRF